MGYFTQGRRRALKQIVYGQPVVDWVAKQMKRGDGYGLSSGLGIEENGELIAGVVYNEFNHVNINAHIAGIGKSWLTKEFLWMIFDYPFNQLKAKRISAFIEDENIEAIKFDEHLGFKYETRLKDAYINGDILVYVMRKEDCKWLKLKRVNYE